MRRAWRRSSGSLITSTARSAGSVRRLQRLTIWPRMCSWLCAGAGLTTIRVDLSGPICSGSRFELPRLTSASAGARCHSPSSRRTTLDLVRTICFKASRRARCYWPRWNTFRFRAGPSWSCTRRSTRSRFNEDVAAALKIPKFTVYSRLRKGRREAGGHRASVEERGEDTMRDRSPFSPEVHALLDRERSSPPIPATQRARALARARAALATPATAPTVVTAPPLRWAVAAAAGLVASAAIAAAAYEIHARRNRVTDRAAAGAGPCARANRRASGSSPGPRAGRARAGSDTRASRAHRDPV